MHRRKRMRKQGSSVLLPVLVLIALASLLMAGMQRRQAYQIHQSAQFMYAMQAWHYMLGAEAYTRQLLYQDREPEDYSAETWTKPKAAFLLPQANMQIDIQDLQGTFNLNSLVADPENASAALVYSSILMQIMLQAGVDTQSAENVSSKLKEIALRDSFGAANSAIPDVSDNVHPPAEPQSSETEATENAPPPNTEPTVNCGGRPFIADTTQLLDLGLSVENYRKIIPYISALPETCLRININMISPLMERVLFTEAMHKSVNAIRERQKFLKDADITKLALPKFFVASSNYFRVNVAFKDDNGEYGLVSILNRRRSKQNDLQIATIERHWQRCLECFP